MIPVQVKPLIRGFSLVAFAIFNKVENQLSGNSKLMPADASALFQIAAKIAAAGVVAINTIRSLEGITYLDSLQLYQAQQGFEDMRGLLINVDVPGTMPNNDALLSSSSGVSGYGYPTSVYESMNPFAEMFATKLAIKYSSAAAQAMQFLASADTVLNPLTLETLAYNLQVINQGFEL